MAININNIANSTIHRLTADEIGEFGLLNYGVYTYRGELKSRKAGFKRTVVNEWQINFKRDDSIWRFEFVRIRQTSKAAEYAMRVYNTENNEYSTMFPICTGVDFLK